MVPAGFECAIIAQQFRNLDLLPVSGRTMRAVLRTAGTRGSSTKATVERAFRPAGLGRGMNFYKRLLKLHHAVHEPNLNKNHLNVAALPTKGQAALKAATEAGSPCR